MKPTEILYYLCHPYQLRALIQWKLWRQPLHERQLEKECPTLRRCFHFLDMTSRSFSSVIQELNPELCIPVTLFYLILRGLDTIEDDMTIPLETKEPILRSFHEILDQRDWTFNGCGPAEKDRQLLVEFNVVTEEFAKIKPAYQRIIKNITKKMGNGMADYAHNAEHNVNGVNTVEDYDLYCHYVAGLVGEGLTALFVEGRLANPVLLERPHLSNAMGLFLQKTNIIRDYREDLEDGRRFWPKQIWIKYVTEFRDLTKPENADIAMNCISEMCLNALGHADECLFYLAGIKDQSVFNFAAIPQVMAIATLALVYRNKEVFQKNVKIPKGEACELILEATNLRSVCAIFLKYMTIIRQKSHPRDPNFLKVSVACGKVEQFIESIFPTPSPTNAQVLKREGEAQDDGTVSTKELMLLIGTAVVVLLLLAVLTIFVSWLAGARFDLAIQELLGQLPDDSAPTAITDSRATPHAEL